MTSMELVLALLRSALWKEKLPSIEWSDSKWEDVYKTASSQGVHTIISDVFSKACVPPKAILSRWMMETARAESVADRIKKAAGELSSHWDDKGLDYVILKGINIAGLYPHPDHRLSGDIDFYFPDVFGWERAYKSARRLSDVNADSDGDIHYVWRGIVVEHHRGWSHLSSGKASALAPRVRNHALCPEDDLLMLSSHILKHAMVGGVGLRQITDLAVATRAYSGKYDREAFCQRLDSLGLTKWAGLLSAVMNTAFKLSSKELPVEPDATFQREFMELVIKDGNLGKKNRNLFSGSIKRFRLFVRLCPKEYFARWTSLTRGRARRSFEK